MRTSTVICDNCSTELEVAEDEDEMSHGWVIVSRANPVDDDEVEETQFCSVDCLFVWASVVSV